MEWHADTGNELKYYVNQLNINILGKFPVESAIYNAMYTSAIIINYQESFFIQIGDSFSKYDLACVAGGIRGHERMGSLKYRLPKNDTF